MAQTPTSPKIEELRFKLKTDPKSRHFYPLAEELRKIGQHEEAEKILLEGLEKHPAYLSAWIGLGRVLKDANRHREAIESFQKGLVIDPGNLVAARLIADSYLALGEKVEAIKKFKLVNALMPGDEEIEAHIEALEKELGPPQSVAVEPAQAQSREPVSPESEGAPQAFDASSADERELQSAPLPADGGSEDPSETEIEQAKSFRLRGSDEVPETDSHLAMTRDAGVSPPEEDIFESAARSDDDPAFGAPSTGGALAFDEGTRGMSVLESHADNVSDDNVSDDNDSNDSADIFAASLEIPAPSIDDAPEMEGVETESRADGPWIDDEPQQATNFGVGPRDKEVDPWSDQPRGYAPSSDSQPEAEAVAAELATDAGDAGSNIEDESTAVETGDAREPRSAAGNDAKIRKLKDWESRVARGGGS